MTTTATRLESLPKEVRDGFKAAHYGVTGSGRRETPEENNSFHSVYDKRTFDRDERVRGQAAIDPDALVVYRGRARAEGEDATRVYAIGVLDGKVAMRTNETIYWKGDARCDRKLRGPQIETTEHRLAANLRKSLNELVTKARESVAKADYEALASTRLAKVRERITDTEKELAELRNQETELAVEAEKEQRDGN